MKIFRFKTTTGNGRIALTTVFKPEKDIIVIRQRILADMEDIETGWFKNHKVIKDYKTWRLVELEIVFWEESFEAVKAAVEMLGNDK